MRDFCGGSFQATNKKFLTSIKFFLFFIFYHRLIISFVTPQNVNFLTIRRLTTFNTCPQHQMHNQIEIKKMSNFAVGMNQRFVSAKRLVRYFSEISSELVEHRSKSLSRSQDVSNWPSIAEGFLTARLRVTYYTMKNCRLSDSLIAATKRNVIPATKSFYKYLKIFFAIHYISRMFSCESVFLRWNARLLTY